MCRAARRPSRRRSTAPGRFYLGAFDGETLVARLADRAYDSCFGGVLVPTSGIAGVTVAAEFRGQGGLSPLFLETLRHARDRGALISTLFPTASRIYRKFGYEVIADYVTVALPTTVLAAVPRPAAVRTRRAVSADFDAIRAVYDAWAIAQNGPLSRRGVSFTATADDFLASFTGVTVALDDTDAICGYASWNRGQGYGEQAVISVADLLSTSADGYRALLAMVGSFASVTAITKIDTSGDDLARLFLPTLQWQVVNSSPYMLKIIDVPGAISCRRYPPGLTTDLRFRLQGDFLTENDGGYAIAVSDGRAECVRDDHGERSGADPARAGAAVRRGPISRQSARGRAPARRRPRAGSGLGRPVRRPSATHPRLLLIAVAVRPWAAGPCGLELRWPVLRRAWPVLPNECGPG